MKERVPRHIAIIMDGNGRWAESRKLPRTHGHLEGVRRVADIMEVASNKGVEVLTLYAFSTENWARPDQEVSMLMKMFIEAIKLKLNDLHRQNIKFQTLGRREGVPEPVSKAFQHGITLTQNNTGMVLNIAFNYGSRLEILDAVRSISLKVKEGQLDPKDIDELTISNHLYTYGLPDPDLLIRTSGEKRISNFLLWQLSYAELYFTEKCWPEFTIEEFDKALQDYKQRDRRYGHIKAKA